MTANGGADEIAADLDLLTPVPFRKSMIDSILHCWCGDADYAVEATLWIHGKERPSVRTELNREGKVWLYQNRAGDYVGFGSLSRASWRIREVDMTVQYIPMLGVFTDFQGLPLPASGSPKYCYQIVDHLIDEAEARATSLPLLGLAVHPENAVAIHVYEKVGFARLRSKEGFSRMILRLGTSE